MPPTLPTMHFIPYAPEGIMMHLTGLLKIKRSNCVLKWSKSEVCALLLNAFFFTFESVMMPFKNFYYSNMS